MHPMLCWGLYNFAKSTDSPALTDIVDLMIKMPFDNQMYYYVIETIQRDPGYRASPNSVKFCVRKGVDIRVSFLHN